MIKQLRNAVGLGGKWEEGGPPVAVHGRVAGLFTCHRWSAALGRGGQVVI